MTGPHAHPRQVLLPGFAGTTLPDWVEARLRDGLAGVCLFGENVESRDQVRELTARIRAANPRAVIAIDEEGGDVTRLYYATGSPYPGNAILGRIDDLAVTEAVGSAVGADLADVGVTLDLAPDADVNSNPLNPVIGVRSFGAVAETVARHTAAWVRGLQSAGIAACAKHFPGHGDTQQDSHLALPVVDRGAADLRARELAPFAAAIAAGTRAIMTSHVMLPQLDPTRPATFSRVVLSHLLRVELGFEGAVVTDALDMAGASGETGIPEASVRALGAGSDLLCIGTRNTAAQVDAMEAAIDEAVEQGRLSRERLDDAAARSLTLGVAVPAGTSASGGDVPDLARMADAFDVVIEPEPSARIWPVRLDADVNVAVGEVPWGPFVPGSPWPAKQIVRPGDALVTPPEGAELWLIGRDNHRHSWVRELVDDARTRFPGCVVVDMGWPSDDRSYADIATFGASRRVGDALVALQRTWARSAG